MPISDYNIVIEDPIVSAGDVATIKVSAPISYANDFFVYSIYYNGTPLWELVYGGPFVGYLPLHYTASLDSNAEFTVPIATRDSAPDGGSFEVVLSQSGVTGDRVSVKINSAPVVETTYERITISNTDIYFGCLSAASDVDDQQLTYRLSETSANPSYGTVEINTDGTFTYSPNAAVQVRDYIYFDVFDGLDYTTAAVSLTLLNETKLDNQLEISGQRVQGATLTLASSGIREAGYYAWFRNGNQIEGETAHTYTLTTEDIGSTISGKFYYVDPIDPMTFYSTESNATLAILDASITDNLTAYHWSTHSTINDVSFNYDGLITSVITEYESGRVISAADALATLKLAVGLNPNTNDLPITPYQYIAADVNKDGRVSAADALSILKMAVGLASAPEREWIFVNENTDFWNETASKFTINRSAIDWATISEDALIVDSSINLVAVLKGDVNSTWESDTETLPDGYFNDLEISGIGPSEQWWIV